ncbi:MAG: diadenylate cyclase [Spirochaetota bacterium]
MEALFDLDPGRVVLLSQEDKEGAIAVLVQLIADTIPGINQERLLSAVRFRESQISSRVAPGIAIPHAVLPEIDGAHVALGLHTGGITWDAADDSQVHLVVLLASNEQQHLPQLAAVARALKDQGFSRSLLQAEDKDDLVRRLREGRLQVPSKLALSDEAISRGIIEAALSLSARIENSRVVVHSDAISRGEDLRRLLEGRSVVVAGHTRSESEAFGSFAVPFQGLRRPAQLHLDLLYLASRGHLDGVGFSVSVYGEPGSNRLDAIRLMPVETRLSLAGALSRAALPEDLDEHVLTRTVQLVSELAAEGREGKAVGTLFVIGDTEAVISHIEQLIANPFRGIEERERNILDPSLEESIKEYAKIDGAFIVRGDGVIVAAGAYLVGRPPKEALHPGLGARHAAALGITALTNAVALVLSESTRTVSVFHAGQRVTTL